MDPALIGHWRVKAIDMVVGRAVSLIGGLPGEHVEFTADGEYRTEPDLASGVCLYRSSPSADPAELDIWSRHLESLTTHCIYRIEGKVLTICIAGDSGSRPTELRRDDERLWCLKTLERSTPPSRFRFRRSRPSLEPGSFIPKGFLEEEPSLFEKLLSKLRRLFGRA